MAHEIYISHTYRCSVRNCKNSITRGGEEEAVLKEVDALGWHINQSFCDFYYYDICPDCARIIKNFVKDEG